LLRTLAPYVLTALASTRLAAGAPAGLHAAQEVLHAATRAARHGGHDSDDDERGERDDD